MAAGEPSLSTSEPPIGTPRAAILRRRLIHIGRFRVDALVRIFLDRDVQTRVAAVASYKFRVVEKSAPVNEVVTAINEQLDAGGGWDGIRGVIIDGIAKIDDRLVVLLSPEAIVAVGGDFSTAPAELAAAVQQGIPRLGSATTDAYTYLGAQCSTFSLEAAAKRSVRSMKNSIRSSSTASRASRN